VRNPRVPDVGCGAFACTANGFIFIAGTFHFDLVFSLIMVNLSASTFAAKTIFLLPYFVHVKYFTVVV